MSNNDIEKERANTFLSIIKESGVDWAKKICEELENGDEIRRPNSYKSAHPISNFEEVTFNIQKCKSKRLRRIIPHDGNYYLKPLSNSESNSSNSIEISNDDLLQLPEQEINDTNTHSQNYSKLFPS